MSTPATPAATPATPPATPATPASLPRTYYYYRGDNPSRFSTVYRRETEKYVELRRGLTTDFSRHHPARTWDTELAWRKSLPPHVETDIHCTIASGEKHHDGIIEYRTGGGTGIPSSVQVVSSLASGLIQEDSRAGIP